MVDSSTSVQPVKIKFKPRIAIAKNSESSFFISYKFPIYYNIARFRVDFRRLWQDLSDAQVFLYFNELNIDCEFPVSLDLQQIIQSHGTGVAEIYYDKG